MNINAGDLEQVIRRIIAESMALKDSQSWKQEDPSGVICISAPKVTCEKFPFPIPSDRVFLKDVLTVEESPRLGCGIMEMEETSFEWTLTYDEVDYVIEGTLEIIVEGRKVTANAGEVIFIPKDTKIHFSTPNKTRFLYVVYPATWADSNR